MIIMETFGISKDQTGSSIFAGKENLPSDVWLIAIGWKLAGK